jgi:hypothetical protein
VTDETKCPKCGGEILLGYGLAGGGIGGYRYCDTDDCDFFDKTQDADEERGARESQEKKP